MIQDDSPFYLAVNNTLKADSLARKGWFKSGAVGVNKLSGVMKTIVQNTGTENEDWLRNHSGRKTMRIQTLSEHDILSGQNNVKSLKKLLHCFNETTNAHGKSAKQSSSSQSDCLSSSDSQNTGK